VNFKRFFSTLLLIIIPVASASAQQQLPGKVLIAWNRFYDYPEVLKMANDLVTAYPNLLSLQEIGRTSQNRPLIVIILNNPATGADTSKPAMWIDGNIHGNEIQATETVMYSVDYLCRAYGKVPALTELVDRCAFYFLPAVNPDGRANWFSQQNSSHSSRTGMQPTDDDRDGVCDEDGPDDLDGDGSIGQMWRKDSKGSHRRNARDPRILERVSTELRPDGTMEYGEWSMAGSEGIDNDGDGRVNEDGPGGYDMNRNWAADWQPEHVQGGAGDFPFCFPETKAISQWILKHPNIAAGQSYHNAGGMILRGPGAYYLEGEYVGADRATYDSIANVGAEMLPFYRSMVIYQDLYTVHGGFVNWLAESLGVITFTNELWSDKRILQNGSDPSPEQMTHWRDRLLFGQTTTDWKEMQHPEYGTVLIGGGNKWSSRIPPPFMLEEEAHRNFAFTAFHAEQMPLLRFQPIHIKQMSDGLWMITIEIANDRRIPTRTVRAERKHIGMPDRLTVDGANITVVSAGPMRQRLGTTFEPVRFNPQELAVEGGITGLSTETFRFIVQGKVGAAVKVKYSGEKFRDIEESFTLSAKP
jgi:hypothetical protein